MRANTALTQVVIVFSVLGTGCSIVPGNSTETCVDWVHFETPQKQFDNAAMVLIGMPAGKDGETSAYGYKAQTHLVDVEKILKGNPGAGPVRISSMPQTCGNGDSYPNGDPLDTSRRMIIFTTNQGGEWFTMTPTQGVLLLDQGAKLPFSLQQNQ